MTVCRVSTAKAERLAAYFELRFDGLDKWAAAAQLRCNNHRTTTVYERWFEFFCSKRGEAAVP